MWIYNFYITWGGEEYWLQTKDPLGGINANNIKESRKGDIVILMGKIYSHNKNRNITLFDIVRVN